MEWQPIETAPRDGTVIWTAYNHEADSCTDPLEPLRLTPYAAHAEGGDFLDGVGQQPAKWVDGWFESEDEYGNGYDLPGWWFAWFNGDTDFVLNPTHWMPLPPPPTP